MDKNKALELLGVTAQTSATDITAAIAAKKQLLQQKRDAAPTEVLKAKFDMMLLQLNEAETLLQAASSTSSQAKASSPLSQTKLADLPSMAAGDAEQLALQQGQVLAGRYEVKELLGQGGMGAVYRVSDKNRGQDIAIKLLLPSLTKNERARERFLNEARLSSSLSHPNIVNVFDVQNDGDLYFLTMELLEGQDLRQVMDNQKLVGRPFDIEDIKHYLAAVCEGLAEAHKLTVHRDIKPENIWIGSDGTIKLMDFGIAQAQSTSQRTKTGAAMGTAYYMAPEQLKGLSDIDGRADQYAVAVLAYELLTSEVPAGAIEPVSDLRKDTPKAMAAAIMQALSPRAENRFASITEFNSALQSGKAPKASKTKTTSYSSSHSSAKWPMVAGVIAVLVVGGGLFGTGIVDVKKLMPVSKDALAVQKAEVAKVQGEIKVLKQRLDNGRRQLDSDVRDAERNKDKNLTALNQWQKLTERVIFEGNLITELEGELSMAESLLRENSPEQAKASVDKVRNGYKQLWDSFAAGERVSVLSPVVAALRKQWQDKPNSKIWPVSQSTEALYQEAYQLETDGRLHHAQPLLAKLDAGYSALLAASNDIDTLKTELSQAQTSWKKLASSKQLTDVAEIASLQKEETNHWEVLTAATDLAAITEAMQGLKGQVSTYQSLTASVKNLAQAEKHAQAAQAIFEKSRQGYPLPANTTATIAAESFEAARTALQNKNWVAAGKGFADTKQHFELAQQQEAKPRAVIDDARSAQQQALKAQTVYQQVKQKANELKMAANADVAVKALASASQSMQQQDWQQATTSFKAAQKEFDTASNKIKVAEQEILMQRLVQQATGPMIPISGGSFVMGNDDRFDSGNHTPAHQVRISSFSIGEAEVTFAQWDACVAAGGCSHKPDDRGWGRGNRPVINVSYNDITQQFIPWLNKTTGRLFRLPTEAEWEYAASAGSSAKYGWGESINCTQARYGRNSDDGECGNDEMTVPVKSYPANAFGLFDMYGNVYEWVEDCYNGNYKGAPVDGSAWRSGNCSYSMKRGGSAAMNADFFDLNQRSYSKKFERSYITGFRLAEGK